MKNYSLVEFNMLFLKDDTNKVWRLEEIIKLYAWTIEVYGYVNDDNFNIDYVIDNKELVDFE